MLKPKNIKRKHWGKITVTDITGIPLMLPRADGTFYDSGDYSDFVCTLECDCGNVKRIKDSEFKGTHTIECCDDCKAAASVKPMRSVGRPKRVGVSVTIQLTWPQATELMRITKEAEDLERAAKQALEEYLAWKLLAPMPDNSDEWIDGTTVPLV